MPAVRRICPHCHEPYPLEANSCPHCGQSAEPLAPASAHRQLSAIVARAALPVALGLAGIVTRAGLAFLRGVLARALSPAPADLPARPQSRSHTVVRVWQEREVKDASGRHIWERIHQRWEISGE
jgi:hypothetical protein